MTILSQSMVRLKDGVTRIPLIKVVYDVTGPKPTVSFIMGLVQEGMNLTIKAVPLRDILDEDYRALCIQDMK